MDKIIPKIKVTLHMEQQARAALFELGATERTLGDLVSHIILEYYTRVKLKRERVYTLSEIAGELEFFADKLRKADK